MSRVPKVRVREVNKAPLRARGAYVLYWMTAHRRVAWNFALDRACELCDELGKPLVVFEALRVGYPWASRRSHRFIIDGMVEHSAVLDAAGITYFPFVEPVKGAGSGLLERLGEDAAGVVTDDYPCFFHPRMLAAAAKKLTVRLEAVDSNGLYPIRATDRVFARAFDLRRYLQQHLPEHLLEFPSPTPLGDREVLRGGVIPQSVVSRWNSFRVEEADDVLNGLRIDQSVQETKLRGGSTAATDELTRFLEKRLQLYGESRNNPEEQVTSGLSPYLHFGHVSVHEAFYKLSSREDWDPTRLADSTSGKRTGWWGLSEEADSFLDELVTWRELGFNFCSHRSDYARYESLPDWSRKTLAEHASDERPYVYDLDTFERARTHDELWNAAQNELRHRGLIHNYLRMLWGKKILHWTASPQEALEIMIELNNKYALDGRDPNSYSGIFWVLGRYDRAWGPEREVFGKVRYMTVANTHRKFRVARYLERWTKHPSRLPSS